MHCGVASRAGATKGWGSGVVGSAVEFELELATCNWQRSEVRSSAHKKSIKSEASASSPLCQFASCYCSCAQFGLCPSVRESIYAPPSQLELELECMRVLASAFSRINSESCAKRTRQDTKETDTETVRKKETVRERGGGRKGTAQTDCASHVRDLLNVLNFQMTLRAAGS